MELRVKDLKSLIIFVKSSILDVWLDSEYTSDVGPVLKRHLIVWKFCPYIIGSKICR